MQALKPSNTTTLVYDFLNNFNSLHTRNSYARDLKEFIVFFENEVQHPKDITLNLGIKYRDALLSNLSSSSVNRKLSSVKSFLNWCTYCQVLTNNPFEHLKLPKVSVENPTLALTDDEVVKILKIPNINTFYGNLHFLILNLLLKLGLRRSELVEIRLEDFFNDRGVHILKIRGKGGKQRLLPLTEELKITIKNYIDTYKLFTGNSLKESDYLIQTSEKISTNSMDSSSIYRIVNKYAKKVGITRRIGAHSCRATVISHLLENQVSPRDVADFAGHSSISTTIGVYDKKRNGLKNSAALKVRFEDVK